MVILSNDFRNVNIYPEQNEILGLTTPTVITKNIINGAFTSVEEYLDIQFRLLREDFVANLRKALESYRANEYTKDIEIYHDVRIFRERNRRNEECLRIRIPSQPDDNKKFMNGSLLLFTKDNFYSLFLAKVVQRHIESEQVTIELIDPLLEVNIFNQYFTMAECGKYFDPYFQVLSALQNISIQNFPMKQYIVNVDGSSVRMPQYLLENYQMSSSMLLKLNQKSLNLNDAQFTAYKAALTQEFVVIQGPPGTGKSHLGVKIATAFIQNKHLWYKNTPLLVVSYKNDALDHFLEALLPITDQLARVGSQSKSEKLSPFVVTKSMGGASSRTRPRDYFTRMSSSLVVGMTTSIASRWKDDLIRLKCPIVIVEEAAEILEAHVVAALTDFCQHLILIGDHKQLQPMSADHNIRKNYNLGISLFERMVRNKVQHYQLNIQHRMKPEIADLVKIKIYPFLTDHDSVKNRPRIRGVQKDLYFIDHRNPEESINTTKKNSFEARFVTCFARYLILNGYTGSDIAILATYTGQVQELEELAAKERFLENVKISTLDGFQGQEAEIVLLSLVRSDAIGFLERENRVGVALSRARSGFYIAGNMNLLARNSKLWLGVKNCLARQNAIGSKLSLCCQNHRSTTTIESLEDFWKVQNGGCSKKCGQLLSCGHCCSMLCHNECMKHRCERGCLKSSLLSENQINYNNLWRSDNDVRNRSNFESYRQGVAQEVESERGFMEAILSGLKSVVMNVVHFFIERFF